MKIGLYFGSFNPIHTGHLIIANHVLNSGLLDKLWFVVSPQNPLKKSNSLLNEYDRLHLVRIATEEDNRIFVTDVEFQLEKPSYTSQTLIYLCEKYPYHHFYIIIGSDSYQNLPQWKNGSFMIKHYDFIIYPRPGFSINNELPSNMHFIAAAPLLDISSTQIRNLIKGGKSIRYMVPDKVFEEIGANRFYKK
jgi:nicotinate-nucleotide adenylyltransferase